MKLSDIHCHMLYGVDDGPGSRKSMTLMIDRAYAGGVRVICMTPHYNPEYFDTPLKIVIERYSEAVKYAGEKYPDLRIFLGQEVYYHHDSVEDLLAGRCLTLNRTRNVLVEFGPYDDKTAIIGGTDKLLCSGFIPVIAHVERYSALRRGKKDIAELRDRGAYIQVNSSTILGERGFMAKRFVLSLIKAGLVDVIADDCHNVRDKLPCQDKAYRAVRDKFGRETADALFWKNPLSLLKGQ